MKNIGRLAIAAALFWAAPVWAIDIAGWTCSNDLGCGALGADGAVSAAPVPGSTGYGWVSTRSKGSLPPDFPSTSLPTGAPSGGVKNGATLTSPPFAAAANAPVSFYFNYVTSDGATYTDYAWARLLDNAGNQVALLFTARTDAVQSVVPGHDMPQPQATLTPAHVAINGGAPSWTPLGENSSNMCYGPGCGYSGWVRASYTVPAAGTYRLEIGVVNWVDTTYQSGLAIDGLLVAGQPPGPGAPAVAPVPTLDVAGLGLLSVVMVGFAARRRRASHRESRRGSPL